MKDNSLVFTDEEGIETTFYIIEQTVVCGITYLLVTDEDDEDEEDEGSFLILKENASDSRGEMAAFDVVCDEEELKSVAKIFSELLDDIDLEV